MDNVFGRVRIRWIKSPLMVTFNNTGAVNQTVRIGKGVNPTKHNEYGEKKAAKC